MSSKIKIAPSLLAADLSRLKEEVLAVEAAGADLLHFDVMDGHFVPNISMGLPVIESVRKYTKLPFDAHLMISDADSYIEEFHKVGCNWLSVHVEACPHLNRTLNRIRELGMRAGIAINPGTSLAALDGAIDSADYILIMSVNPGFGGQKFIPQSLQRISELRKKLGTRPVQVEVDGGIKAENIGEIAKAGAEIMVVGTGLFSQKDYKTGISELRGRVA